MLVKSFLKINKNNLDPNLIINLTFLLNYDNIIKRIKRINVIKLHVTRFRVFVNYVF